MGWLLVLVALVAVPVAVYGFLFRAEGPTRTRRPPKALPVVNEAAEERVCVIGGGFKGLAACTELQRKRVPFVLLEKESEVGGHWRDLPDSYHSVLSRKALEFPDFPFSYHRVGGRHSDFPSSRQVVVYLQDYWSYLSFPDRTELSTEVESIAPVTEGEHEGQWLVHVKGEQGPRRYLSVIVAGGHKSGRRWPTWAPLKELGRESGASEGVKRVGRVQWVHVKDIRSYTKAKEERVLVAGGGNTACMVASEEACMAMTPLSMSFDRPLHILPRTVGGFPLTHFARQWTPPALQLLLLRLVWWINFGDYGQYSLAAPSHGIYERPLAINSELLLFIKMGRVRPYGAVTLVSREGLVRYEGGEEEEVDTVLCATGYTRRYGLVSGHLQMRGETPLGLVCGALSERHRNLFVLGARRVSGSEGGVRCAVSSLIVSAILWQKERDSRRPSSAAPASAALAISRLPLFSSLYPQTAPAPDVAFDPHAYFAELRLAKWALAALATLGVAS